MSKASKEVLNELETLAVIHLNNLQKPKKYAKKLLHLAVTKKVSY